MMEVLKVDFNCDIGEDFGILRSGCNPDLFQYVTSCNIACGFHGGDPSTIMNTIEKAKKQKVSIGAHPSYPDLMGFGRRSMKMDKNDLRAALIYQLSAIKGIVNFHDLKMNHIKLHGALYNDTMSDPAQAKIIAKTIFEFDKNISVYGLPNSYLAKECHQLGVDFMAEAFLDRTYSEDGNLTPRSEANSVIYDPKIALEQFLSIINEKKVVTANGKIVELRNIKTFCIHSDNPKALQIMSYIFSFLNKNNISIEI